MNQASDMQYQRVTAGWREWVSLPELGIHWIKAKMDTGARTSCIHAFEVEAFNNDQGEEWVRFALHPHQEETETVIRCEAPILDVRKVTDSGGHSEMRYVIKTPLLCGGRTWPIEITLTNRDIMKFRMLIGRTAMLSKLMIDPELSYQFGKPEF
ncbi:ATP-dependent zinc protease [Neptunomonas concharum]|nr:ATP-dependent zinc protease [Neptunomonas concharum]